MKSKRTAFDLFVRFFFFCHLLLSCPLEWHSFHTMLSSSSTQNNYQALPHQIKVDIRGRAGQGWRSAGWPEDVVKRPSNLRGRLFSLGYLYIPWPRFSLVCPNETLSCSQGNRGLAVAGLGGQSTMRRRAVVRQGHICAILLSLGKELMRFNGPSALRTDLLTSTCPFRSTPFCEEAGTPKFL